MEIRSITRSFLAVMTINVAAMGASLESATAGIALNHNETLVRD